MRPMRLRSPQVIPSGSLNKNYIKRSAKQLIAIDKIGAGIGDYVLVSQGSAARIGSGMPDAPVDAAIVGIIDDGTGLE